MDTMLLTALYEMFGAIIGVLNSSNLKETDSGLYHCLKTHAGDARIAITLRLGGLK